MFDTSTQNPIGVNPGSNIIANVYSRGGAQVAKKLVYFDIAASDAAVTASKNFGTADHQFSNVLTATATQSQENILAVTTEAIADDALGKVVSRGVVQINTTGISAGDALTSAAAGAVAAAGAGEKVYAIALTDSDANDDFWAIFDGVNGFGVGA